MSRKFERRASRALVVDDSKLVVAGLVLALETLGWEARGLTCPWEALAALEASPDQFDLLIADHRMPSLTGVQLIDKARQVQPSLSTVIYTGLRSQETDGADAYLPKPFEMSELEEVLAAVQ